MAGRYRKVSTQIWSDEKFRGWNMETKLAFLFVLTCPHMTGMGAMRMSIPGLAAELHWPERQLIRSLRGPLKDERIKVDEAACLMVLPNFLKHNPPESPNVVTSWRKVLPELPECELLFQYCQHVKAFLKGFDQAFLKALPKGVFEFADRASPYPEQDPDPDPEQEQEQEQEPEICSETASGSEPDDTVLVFPVIGDKKEWPLTGKALNEYHTAYGSVIDVLMTAKQAHLWCVKNKKRRKTHGGMDRFLDTWMRTTVNKGNGSPPKPLRELKAEAAKMRGARKADVAQKRRHEYRDTECTDPVVISALTESAVKTLAEDTNHD